MTYDELIALMPERRLTQQEAYALEHSGITADEIKNVQFVSRANPYDGKILYDNLINSHIAKGREILKLKGLPLERSQMHNFEPDHQDELAAVGVDNKVLEDKKSELLKKYGPSGDKRYYDFIIEQRKKGRELLDKQKADASKPPATSRPTPPAASTSYPSYPRTTSGQVAQSAPLASPKGNNTTLADPYIRQMNENLRDNLIKLLGPEKGEQAYREHLQALNEDNPGGSAASEAPPQATLPSAPPQDSTIPYSVSYRKLQKLLKGGAERRERANLGDFPDPYAQKAKAGAEATNQPTRKELIPDVGDQVDPETGRRIPAEVVTKLAGQEIARRLANKPYVENPHNKTVELNELEKAGYGVLHDLIDRGQNSQRFTTFVPPEGRGPSAVDYFYDQNAKYDKAMTLKDKVMEGVRANALKRLNKSYEELGHQMSARRIGRNGYEDVLKKEMRENMDNELNQIDSKMAYDLFNQQNQIAGQGVQHVQNQDAIEYKKAHDAYVLNKAEEESRKEEQRKNAMNALDRGQGLRAYEQEALNRRAAEFERKNTHHDVQMDKYLDRLRASAIGTPNLILPDRTQSHSPTFMHNVQPGEPSRMPLGNGAPLLTQVQPDTTMKDLAGVGTAVAGLMLDNKAIDAVGKKRSGIT